MKATETIELDGQSIKLLIEASKVAATSAREAKNSYREMQYVILAAKLTEKLTEFHAKSLQVLEARYCNAEKPAIGVADSSKEVSIVAE